MHVHASKCRDPGAQLATDETIGSSKSGASVDNSKRAAFVIIRKLSQSIYCDAAMEAVSSDNDGLAVFARYASADKSSSSLHPVGGGVACFCGG